MFYRRVLDGRHSARALLGTPYLDGRLTCYACKSAILFKLPGCACTCMCVCVHMRVFAHVSVGVSVSVCVLVCVCVCVCAMCVCDYVASSS